MDGVELVAVLAGLAAVTSWIGMFTSVDKDGYITDIKDMKFAVVCVSIAWLATLLVGVWLIL
jgi:hypothetical protein